MAGQHRLRPGLWRSSAAPPAQTDAGDQLARMLLAGKVHDGDTVLVDQTGEHLELSACERPGIVSDNPTSVDTVTEDK